MLTTEWKIEQAKVVWEREAHEEGREEGVDISTEIIRLLIEKVPINEIADRCKVSVDKIKQLQNVLAQISS